MKPRALQGLLALAGLLLVAGVPAQTQKQKQKHTPVSNIIIGGGMRHCSSFNGAEQGNLCSQPWGQILAQDAALAGLGLERILFDRTVAMPTFSYRIDAAGMQALNALPAALLADASKKKLTANLSASSAKSGLSLAAFESLALGASPELVLSPTERAALLHSFVEPLQPDRRKRQLQARSIVFSSDAETQRIYRAFVQAAAAAGQVKVPRVGLITSASRNPFNDRDINYYALKSAGAEVVWLPLDGALRQALDADDCAHLPIYFNAYANNTANTGGQSSLFHQEQVFPDLADQQLAFCAQQGARLNAELQGLDGVFISGGDQARVLESFISRDASGAHSRSSEQLRLLRERFAAGRLAVAGSSAGNSVQAGGRWRGKPVPMISGGEALQTLSSGFSQGQGPTVEGASKLGVSYAGGGLGLFNFGPLDSHFSERAREARLLRLVADSGMDYGFGVDENTALQVHRADTAGLTAFSVIGAGGVFIVDVRRARASGESAGAFRLHDAAIHYLTAGDSAGIDAAGDLAVSLSADKALLTAQATAARPWQGAVQQPGSFNFVKLTRAMGLGGASEAIGSTAGQVGAVAAAAALADFCLQLKRAPGTEFRAAAKGLVSYKNLRLSVEPVGKGCTAFIQPP